MFTGIVEERGVVAAISPTHLRVRASTVPSGAGIGDSIAVNGVCLTVVERSTQHLAFDVSEETLRRTSFSRLGDGDAVNLERPLTLMSRIGGHLVQGHVDGVGVIAGLERTGDGGAWMSVRPPDELRRYLVEKGSVTVDGISLTVAAFEGATFSVALVPHTLDVTTLGTAEVGHPVNLEVDVIARYVESLLGTVEGRGR